MKERPILFSGPMVRAILEGLKTQTRRVVKPQPNPGYVGHFGSGIPFVMTEKRDVRCPYGQSGDRLWVREAWSVASVATPSTPIRDKVVYRTDFPENYDMFGIPSRRWFPSIHMKRADSRILLEIISVRIERLHDISVSDAIAEGYDGSDDDPVDPSIKWYSRLWEQINGEGAWETNPWVWVIEFKRVQP